MKRTDVNAPSISLPTYASLAELVFPEHERPVALDLLRDEVRGLTKAFRRGEFSLVDPWPYPRGPRGMLELADGSHPHGAYARPRPERHIELVVANNGWPIERFCCPGPLPPGFSAASPINYWVSQQPSLFVSARSLGLIDPGSAAVDRVCRGAKPLGLAETTRADEVDRWKSWAADAGLAVDVQASDCSCWCRRTGVVRPRGAP